MIDKLDFALPPGYRITSAGCKPSVECARGCGWKLQVSTLSALPSQARDQLFRFHDAWHRTAR